MNLIETFQAMLARFLRSNAEYLPSRLYIAYLDMLSSLAGNSHAASQCFNFLNSNSTNGGTLKTVNYELDEYNFIFSIGSLAQLSWAHLFSSLNRFYQTLKAEFASSQNLQSIPTIAPTELKALMSWLKLMQKICENVWLRSGLGYFMSLIFSSLFKDVKCLLAFCERQEWSAMEVLFGFVGCPIPLELKGEIFQTLAVFATNEQLAPNFWVALHNCAALPILPEEKLGGVQVELDEVETRVEVYPVCRGFLSLLAALWGYSDAGEARPYLDYVLGSVLIRFKSRGYKNGVEMWQVGTAVIECIYNILHSCELKKLAALTSGESLLNSVGCQALIHLLSDPPVLKTVSLPTYNIYPDKLNVSIFLQILGILEDGIQLLDTFKDFSGENRL